MQIKIVAVGKLKEPYLRAGVAEYQKRLTAYCRLETVELAEEKISAEPLSFEISQVKAKEGQRILQAIEPDSFHIALDLAGKPLSSEQLADKLAELALVGRSRLAFAIGGSHGLSDAVLAAADLRLSFGNMTYPHQLMRLILLEQIYRAFKINRGEAYHK